MLDAPETLGDLLNAARNKADLTLKELAQKTDTSFQHISKVERDESDLSLPLLRRLDKALKLPDRILVKMIRATRQSDGGRDCPA